jgi:hypothetical protein
MKRWITIGLLVPLLGQISPAPAQETEQAPAIDRCREFCARVYGESGSEYDECAVACGDADVCHRDCKQKFGDDQPKVRSCLRRCMHRNEESPPPPAQAPVRL